MKIKNFLKAGFIPVLVIILMSSMTFLSFADDNSVKWIAKKEMSVARYGLGTATVNGKIYAIGGFDSSNKPLDLVEEYDPNTNKWITKKSMKTARGTFATAVVDGKIYTIGGYNGNDPMHPTGCLNIVEVYDPQTDTWTDKKPMLNGRSWINAAVANGKIYVFSGLNNGYLNGIEEYDPGTDSWTAINDSIPYTKGAMKIVAINNKIYIFGAGNKDNLNAINATIEYDPLIHIYKYKKNMVSLGDTLSATVIDGKAVITRFSNNNYLVEEYNPETDSWKTYPNMTYNRSFLGITECSGKLYAIGGTTSGGTTNSVEELASGEIAIPKNLKAVQNNSKVTLIWDTADGAVSYNVKRSETSGGPYTTIASDVKVSTYIDETAVVGKTYYYVVTAVSVNGESKISNEVSTLPVTTDPSLTATAKDKVKIGDEFTTEIAIRNVKNICAEDIKITYDTNLFEYIGSEAQAGLKIYKEDNSTPGTIRFIVACLGKDNAATGDKSLIKLKFKAKKQGEGKVDIVRGRIADNATLEMDVEDTNCGEAIIKVEAGNDVNRSGEFTLLDLGIDAWYYSLNASDTDISKYDADVDVNGVIDDGDLTSITDSILSNKNYEPNN